MLYSVDAKHEYDKTLSDWMLCLISPYVLEKRACDKKYKSIYQSERFVSLGHDKA